jgi:uncharacterized protein with HEPN domain
MSEEKTARIVKDYLNDILENIKDIYAFIENMDFEDLKSDFSFCFRALATCRHCASTPREITIPL